MLRFVLVLVALLCAGSGVVKAQEYCVDKYNNDITKVNAELGGLMARQSSIDKRLTEILLRGNEIASAIAQAALSSPPDLDKVKSLSQELNGLSVEKDKLQAEGFQNQDKITALKGIIPADLQGRLRGCVEATAPVGKIVNLAIQALAILSTGGASFALPPKALYIDMAAELNGYPTGGPHSIINESRDAALNALGIGGQNNDIAKAVRDPLRVVRCVFGC